MWLNIAVSNSRREILKDLLLYSFLSLTEKRIFRKESSTEMILETGMTRFNALGPIYMVSSTRDNPPYRGNFIERLYEEKLSVLAESKLTLLKYS